MQSSRSSRVVDPRASTHVQRNTTAQAQETDEQASEHERARGAEVSNKAMSSGAGIDPRRAMSLQGMVGNRAVLRMLNTQVMPKRLDETEGEPDQDAREQYGISTAEGASAPPGAADNALARQVQRVTSMPIDGAPKIMRAVTAKKVFKKIGLGVVNLAFETFIGPLTDLKSAIRLIWEDGDKAKKTKERWAEEWTGKYGGKTWMTVLHGITTAVEKIGGLAGAIALLATLASIAAPAAAPVAAVAGVIGLVCAGIALITRSILSGAALHYYKKGEGDDFKKMAITNLVGAIGNLLGVVSFGVGAGVAGGVSFDAQTTTTAGRDLGIGAAFSTSTKVSSVTTDLVQSKRLDMLMNNPNALMRDPDEKKGGVNHPNVVAVTAALNEAEEVVPELKKSNRQDRTDLQHDIGVMGKVSGKLGKLTEKQGELDAKATEAESETSEMEGDEITPQEGEEVEYKENEVAEMETHLNTADSYSGRETVGMDEAKREQAKVKGKEGFFSRLKRGLKKIGKKIAGAFTSIGQRVKAAFARVRALIQKIKAKLVDMVLSAAGLKEKLATVNEGFQADQEQLGSESESIADNEARTETLDGKLREMR